MALEKDALNKRFIVIITDRQESKIKKLSLSFINNPPILL